MGKHAATDESPGDPLVADALIQRGPEGTGAHREEDAAHRESSAALADGALGWPASPAPGGAGIGWPQGLEAYGAAPAP